MGRVADASPVKRGLFDRGAGEGGYRSEELEKALKVVRAAVAG